MQKTPTRLKFLLGIWAVSIVMYLSGFALTSDSEHVFNAIYTGICFATIAVGNDWARRIVLVLTGINLGFLAIGLVFIVSTAQFGSIFNWALSVGINIFTFTTLKDLSVQRWMYTRWSKPMEENLL